MKYYDNRRHVILGAFYGSIWYHLSDEEYLERFSLIFFSLVGLTLGHQQAMPIIFQERLLFYRERGAKAYGALPYWLSGLVLSVPLTALNVLLYSSMLYYMCGFSTAPGRFEVFYCVMFCSSLSGLFTCQLLAAISPTEPSAVNLFPVVIYYGLAFSGYAVYIPQIPYWLRCWAPFGSFFRWAYQALVLNELEGNSDLDAGQYYIDEMGLNGYSRSDCLLIVPVFSLVFASMVLIALRFVNYEKR